MPRKETEEKNGDKCSVEGCSGLAHRSLSRKKVAEAMAISLKAESRKVHLCKEHYKAYKKATKKDRELERLGW